MNNAYSDFLQTIGDKFNSLIGEIKTDYNFDLGDEFEIAICKALKIILPIKYGVCRGTVFTIDNRFVGDDIIIFDQWRFPMLRLLDDNNYAQKQRIPIEAVVAYIEAKNTIVLEEGHGNSLNKAIEQATAIKKLGRKEMPLNPFAIDNIDNFLGAKMPREFPQINNPLYTCVFTRGVRENANSKMLDSSIIDRSMSGKVLSSEGVCVDLFIFNKDIVAFPLVKDGFFSPFWIKDVTTHYQIFKKENVAWGVGISLLFLAFESIRLGCMEWKKIIGQALDMEGRSNVNNLNKV